MDGTQLHSVMCYMALERAASDALELKRGKRLIRQKADNEKSENVLNGKPKYCISTHNTIETRNSV